MYYSRKTHYAIIDADVPNVLVCIFTKDFGLNIGLGYSYWPFVIFMVVIVKSSLQKLYGCHFDWLTVTEYLCHKWPLKCSPCDHNPFLSSFMTYHVSALTWFIRYIYYWNLQFLNNVIINETKVLLPQALVTWDDFGSPV